VSRRPLSFPDKATGPERMVYPLLRTRKRIARPFENDRYAKRDGKLDFAPVL